MKKLIIVLTFLFSLAFASKALADENIKLNINNNTIESDISPQIIEGRTMVPVRAIFEAIGADVEWNNETKTITGHKDNTEVIMTLNSNIASINNKKITMDCGPVIINNRTLAPVRYVAEAFGCQVEWDNENKTVNINTPEPEPKTTAVETASETTTIITTEKASETTTNPMYSYDTYYKPGTYMAGNDIPKGEYVVFSNPGKIGYVYKYAKDGNVSSTTGKRQLYRNYFSYCDVIKLDNNNYIDLSNAYAVPSADVAKLEAWHNGTFRAGTDIKTGHLTFKLSPESSIGYIDIGFHDAKAEDKTMVYLTPESDSVTVNVTQGMFIKLFACDVLDETLSAIHTYRPVLKSYNNTDAKLNFDDVTPSLKKTVDDYLTTLVNELNYNSLKGTKYTSNYANKILKDWNSVAKNSADKKYISVASEIYAGIRSYANGTKGDIASASVIMMNGKQISGAEYRSILKYEKDYITNTVSNFKSGTSFEKLEIASRTITLLRYDIPRLSGRKVS
ncbi:MAG: copper amine oxidase N-terminal domain-containing protein [Clostridia bacterium]|nr:copper amine oxidase N-terminal domain-containing protein [Clostridia bacterium]